MDTIERRLSGSSARGGSAYIPLSRDIRYTQTLCKIMQINLKVIHKEDWIRLLKRDLFPIPVVYGKPYQFTPPEHIIITITTKNINRRNYTFGGPIWSAILDFSYDNDLIISFLSPRKKPHRVKWNKVKEITFRYLSA